MKSPVLLTALAAAQILSAASGPDWNRALELYQKTEYSQSLAILEKSVKDAGKDQQPSAATWQLIGQNYYGLGKYKDATDALEKAVEAAPSSSDAYLWLGRAYGRRAETSSFLTAPRYASKTHQYFEKALELDASNLDAADDLLEYYLEAPGFLGGGKDKARALAPQIAKLNQAQGEKALAKIAEKDGDYEAAERHYRRAIELQPGKPGRLLDLARFYAKRDWTEESDRLYAQAAEAAPGDPEVWFARARTLIDQKRNLAEARRLLNRYIAADLTPDNPSRDEARELLRKTR